MREKLLSPFTNLHRSAKIVIKTGSLTADVLLIMAFAILSKETVLAMQMAETAAYLFSIGMVGGLLLDVIAKRMGK